MQDFDAIVAFRRGERVRDVKPNRCPECNIVRPDVDLFGQDTESGELLWICAECVGRDDLEGHRAAGLAVDCLVTFDGKTTPSCLPVSWFTGRAYGTLLKDGRIIWGNREVVPLSYTKVDDP